MPVFGVSGGKWSSMALAPSHPKSEVGDRLPDVLRQGITRPQFLHLGALDVLPTDLAGFHQPRTLADTLSIDSSEVRGMTAGQMVFKVTREIVGVVSSDFHAAYLGDDNKCTIRQSTLYRQAALAIEAEGGLVPLRRASLAGGTSSSK